MKKLISIFLVLIASIASVQAETGKLGFVDIQYIMAKSPQRVAIGEKLQKEFKEQEEELKKIYDDIMKLQNKATKDGATMSEKERVELQRQGQEMESNFKLKQANLQEDRQRRAQEEQRILGGKILELIAKFAEEQGYAMIVNKEALLWADPASNVSEQVLAKLSASTN